MTPIAFTVARQDQPWAPRDACRYCDAKEDRMVELGAFAEAEAPKYGSHVGFDILCEDCADALARALDQWRADRA